jgi:hypothetical protein
MARAPAVPARWDGRDLLLTVQTQPRASRDEIVGVTGEAIKIRITAPPVDGRANDHLCAFLAITFGVPRRQVSLEAGETGRLKRFRIQSPRRVPPGLGINTPA